jgi:hypothetical protein
MILSTPIRKRRAAGVIMLSAVLLLTVSSTMNAYAEGADVSAASEVITTDALVNGTSLQDGVQVSNMQYYDGKEVTIEGETIGDIMHRGDYAWITVNDDPYSMPVEGEPGTGRSLEDGGTFAGLTNMGMAVWITREDAQDLHWFGGYKCRGDTVRVTGVFHRACTEHGGDTDIHAINLTLIESGYGYSHPFPVLKLLTVLLLSAVIAVLWTLRRRKIRKGISEA